MLGLIDAEAWGGPEDGATVRCEYRPFTIFRRFNPAVMSWEDSTYALEVTEKGAFRLKHIATVAVEGGRQ